MSKLLGGSCSFRLVSRPINLLFWHYPKIYIFGYSSIALLDPRSSMIADQIDTSDGSRKSFSNQIPVCLDYLFLYSIK